MKVMYFAYGSNMCTRRLKGRIPSAKPLGRAKLPNKRLVCNKRSKDGSGKANLLDSTGDIVWGVLYELELADLEKLDRIERGYKRIVLKVITDQEDQIEAYVYVSSDLMDNARPYNWYKQLMIEGACEHQLPGSYIKYLQQIRSKPAPIKERHNFS